MSKKIFVCCDDAGWQKNNDEVLLQLSRQKRISAISLVVDGANAAQWREYAVQLAPEVALGLHFNLTWQPGSASQGLERLILRSYARRLNKETVKSALQQQLDKFADLIGREVDFIDGHQHVHMLPVVRDALLEVVTARFTGAVAPAIRAPYSICWRGVKAQILNMLGARRLAAELHKRRLTVNSDFVGVYDFDATQPYAQRMRRWLATVADGAMLMTHPGAANEVEHSAARVAEAQFLLSQQWLEMLAEYDLQLQPFKGVAKVGNF